MKGYGMCEKKTPYVCELVARIVSSMDMWLWLMASTTIVMLLEYKEVQNVVLFDVMIVHGCAGV